MWVNKTAIAGPCMIERSISEKSLRKGVEGTETKNVSCSIMDRRQTALDMGYTVGEHEKRRHGTHRFGTGKRTCSTVSRRIYYGYPGFY